MLYDPKWEAQTQPDVFSLESLIAWLEKQPANRKYCYLDNGRCLLGQYFTDMGFKDVRVGGLEFSHAGAPTDIPLPPDFGDLAYEYPRTFGSALKRARAALSAEK